MSRRDPGVTSKMMAAVRAKDTKPEWALRRHLFSRGLRYRLHVRGVTGRPDIVFPKARVAVFVDGDFWHGAGWRERGHADLSEQFPSNTEFWVTKITRNVERDAVVSKRLRAEGWEVIRVFASELASDLGGVGDRIEAAVRATSASTGDGLGSAV